eukprot:TRINITY_DN61275_c0_g1_i1.p1 TRINITY_DN61275_c0_g1~~TRINITY_DN61275_c0_g1_i1.p1  ORF type:complete len:952 (+),score=320.27 TRINITY_DN61275_c0_g1_i1:79-2856(+)
MAAFEPNQQHYLQVVDLLHRATDPRPEVVGNVWELFEEYSQRPDFCCYLAHILTVREHGPQLRQWAAVVLKNGARDNFGPAVRPALPFIQQAVLPCVGDADRGVRNAVANCVATICAEGGIDAWPGLLEHLCGELQKGEDAQQGAMRALRDICEDCGEQFVYHGAPAQLLVPQLLAVLAHPSPSMRSSALWSLLELFTSCREELLALPTAPLWSRRLLPEFFSSAMRFAQDPDDETRKGVCRLLLFAGDVAWHLVSPQLPDIMSYLLAMMARREEDEAVALEACDFWSVAMDHLSSDDRFLGRLGEVVGALLDCLAYSPNELAMLASEGDDCAARPWMGRRRKDEAEGGVQGGDSDGEGVDDDEDGDDDSEEDDEEEAEWGLRRCSGTTLEMMSLQVAADKLLPALLPELQRRLQPGQPWLLREAAVLALGGVVDGLQDTLKPYAAQMVAGLALQEPGGPPPLLRDEHPLVRASACWTLGCLRDWLISDGAALLGRVLEALVGCVADSAKRVQHRACGTVEKLIESLGAGSQQYAAPVLAVVGRCFETYPVANLVHLYDLVITVAEALGAGFANPALLGLVMPPMVQRWNAAPDDAAELPAMMGAFTAVAIAIGPHFQQYTEEAFARACRVLYADAGGMVRLRMEGAPPAAWDEEHCGDEGRIVAALDLVSGLADAVGSSIDALVAAQAPLVPTVLACCADRRRVLVRQSALAVCGDLAKWCYPRLAPAAADALTLAVASIDPASGAQAAKVTTNAVWAIGELAVQAGASLRAMAGGQGEVPAQLIAEMAPLLTAGIGRHLKQNVCISLGRIAFVCPDVAARSFGSWAKDWCVTMRGVEDDAEKEQAFLGACAVARVDPQPLLPHLALFIAAVCSWDSGAMRQCLRDELRGVLQAYKQHIGPPWDGYASNFPADMRARMLAEFGV